MRVLLADDHPLFLDGLEDLLRSNGFEVAGTARDGLEAVEKARALGPEVILMDIRMPRLDGLAALRAIKAELPEAKIVMLTISEADDDLRAAKLFFRQDWRPGFSRNSDARRVRWKRSDGPPACPSASGRC